MNFKIKIASRNIGHNVILPSSFIGNPGHMFQLSQDTMAVVCTYGPASFFITVTANPQWEDVQTALLPGQTACDQRDIVVHVFHQKFSILMHELQNILGEQLARVYTVEFQKQELPHIHLLLWIRHDNLQMTAATIDKVSNKLWLFVLY
jgi:hypothetical protein